MLGLSSYLMVELSNSNALLRVRSRMVTSVFLALSCIFVSFFGDWRGGACVLSFIVALNIFFRAYQQQEAAGLSYFAFCFIALSSMSFVYMLLLVPLLWILMRTHLQMFSWSTWRASVLGLLTPYWIVAPWYVWHRDLETVVSHFLPSVQISIASGLSQLSLMQLLNVAFIVILLLVSAIHFWVNRIDEKIRIRLLYGFLTIMAFVCIGLTALLPQHYNPLLRILIVCASPVIAHFFTFSSSRFTNILFVTAVILCVLLTCINLYDSLFGILVQLLTDTWTGLLSF